MAIRLGKILLTFALVSALSTVVAGTALAQTAVTAARANVTPRAGQRLTATASLTASGAQTVVSLRVTGGDPNAMHVNHIHTGTCEAEGGIVYPLTDIRLDAQGNGTFTTTINASLPTLTTGGNYVNIHAGPALPSPGISCGNIVAGAAALPATGGGFVHLALAISGALGLAGTGLVIRRRA